MSDMASAIVNDINDIVAKQPEQPDVYRAISELITQDGRLTDVVTKLEDRLLPVMKPTLSTTESSGNEWPEMSPIAYQIAGEHDTVRRMVNRLYDLLDRIQI